MGGNTVLPGLTIQRLHSIGGTPGFKGTGLLQILAFEENRCIHETINGST
jgi:hypothetical protein